MKNKKQSPIQERIKELLIHEKYLLESLEANKRRIKRLEEFQKITELK